MPALRFEAARFLAEQILAPQGECWLTAMDTSTARQKAQRGCAAGVFAAGAPGCKAGADGGVAARVGQLLNAPVACQQNLCVLILALLPSAPLTDCGTY